VIIVDPVQFDAVAEKAGLGRSEQFAEFLVRQPGSSHDRSHGEGIHRIISRNRHDMRTIAHLITMCLLWR
jgi:hypothetical protein